MTKPLPPPVYEKSFIFHVKNPDCLHHVKSVYGPASSEYRRFLNGEVFYCSVAHRVQESLRKKGMSNPRDFTLNKIT